MEENLIMEENMIVIKDPTSFSFNSNFPKDVDENLKFEIEFIIKSNESLAEYKKISLFKNCLFIIRGKM